MTTDETAAGTPVLEFTPEEYDAYLETEVRRLSGKGSIEEFVHAYESGEFDEADPAISELAGLLRIGQNGHSVAT